MPVVSAPIIWKPLQPKKPSQKLPPLPFDPFLSSVKKKFRFFVFLLLPLFLTACSSSSRVVSRERGIRASSLDRGAPQHGRFLQTGVASYYGDGFHGKKTANGETFNKNALTAAHRTLPFDTRVRVTNLTNGKKVTVRINDRGPYADGRIIDLSEKAGKKIGLGATGTATVRLEIVR